jgi:hypothetical protein
MKKSFKREGNLLFDETINQGFHKDGFDNGVKKLTKKLREKYLADLGSGSKTEFESADILLWKGDKSPRFLEWLLESCENDALHSKSSLCYALLQFKNDSRVFPALLRSAGKCPDEYFSNYAGLLGIFGGLEAKTILKDKFHNLKNNPQTFAKFKDWNDIGFSLLDICENLLKLEPDNTEAAECLAKLSRHPNSFNQEIAVVRISAFFKNHFIYQHSEIRDIFVNALKSLSKTNNVRLFGYLLPFLFQSNPDKTYERFKKLYLKCNREDRYNQLAFHLIYSVENSLYWISKLVRELPTEETEYFRDYLNSNFVRPITNEEIFDSVRRDFDSESPYKRLYTVEKLKHLDKENAYGLLKNALAAEPDGFIRKKFAKYLTRINTNRIPTK